MTIILEIVEVYAIVLRVLIKSIDHLISDQTDIVNILEVLGLSWS